MFSFAARLARAFDARGLSLVGATTLAAYDDTLPGRRRLAPRHPGARMAVVVGTGGGAFWRRFDVARAQARWLIGRADPLDAFTRVVVAQAVCEAQAIHPVPCRLVFPSDASIDFRRLAVLAGLAVPSRVGTLMHPVFGQWVALRAAVLVPRPETLPRPAAGFDPCGTCLDHPCEPACPVRAVSVRGWDGATCAGHRTDPGDSCAAGCHARLACPVGGAHRPPPDALRHHQAAARRLMQVRISLSGR